MDSLDEVARRNYQEMRPRILGIVVMYVAAILPVAVVITAGWWFPLFLSRPY